MSSQRCETITITDKVVKMSSKTSIYLIFDKDENADDIFFWKFDSSNLYGDMNIGDTYIVKIVGWRVPFLSWYPNIISAEKE